ncbi:hypothetical protein CAC42_6353 [Sphaceloma murrayae]|uniref:rRNA-processing protein EFG1 n=1 Tax=Sphaceloma murrayae TaxID=2082308 RepID=A0A2K1QM65_9PEZI|nr:hypothetical protein CAC42_6353 [Sphaceloma murrayae]
MGTKRPHTPSTASAHQEHKKRKPNNPSDPSSSRRPHKPAPKANPVNPLRARIRSLKRLLAHDDAFDDAPRPHPSAPSQDLDADGLHPSRSAILHGKDELEIAAKRERREEGKRKRLPMNVRLERERELRGLEEKVEEVERKRRRGEMVGRWHMVRFFERRRGERRLRGLKRELEGLEEGDGEGRRVLMERIRRAEVDLNYALFWPLERAYVSLWPRKKKGEGKEGKDGGGDGVEDREEARGDRQMWALVERCMAEGTLEDLKEGRVEGCGVERYEKHVKGKDGVNKHGGKDGKRKDGAKMANVKDSRPAKENSPEDEDSDGGFFE